MDSDSRYTKKSGLLHKNQRLLSFLQDHKFVDCTFKVEGAEVKAHKLVLACSSPVFEKMLFGEMASDNVVEELSDINLEEFKQMLHFVYTGELNIHSVVNAWSLFYVANKYLLDDLLNICLEYIIKNVTMSTLVLSYEYSEMYDITELKNNCFMDIINYINAVFTSDYHMKPSTLRSILVAHSKLQVDNFVLASGVIEWGATECDYRQLQVIPTNIINILKDENILEFMYKDWFSAQCDTCEDTLVMCQCASEIVHKTLIHLVDEIDPKVQINSTSGTFRTGPFNNCKYRRIFKIARRIDLDQTEEFVSHMSVNRKTLIVGFLLETEMNLSLCDVFYQGSISVTVCEQGEKSTRICSKPTTVKQVLCYNSQHYVPFRNAVTLEPNRIYDVRISYKNYSTLISSVICHYMSDDLYDKTKDSTILFYDTMGSVIRGVAFYPA